MTDSTAVFGLTMPSADGSDNFSADLWRDLAQDVEDKSPGITPMTTTTRTGLTGGDKYNGRVVYDTTVNKLFVSDGTNWHEVTQAALPLAGGTMTGNIAMGGTNKVTGLAAATTNGDAVRYEQISTLGNWQAWTPTLAVGSGSVTATATANENRYTQIGKTIHGIGHMNVTAATGTANIRIPLPVTPTSTSAIARRVGMVQMFADGYLDQYFLEQAQNATFCSAVGMSGSYGSTARFLTSTIVANYISNFGAGDTFLVWNFTYEAA